MYKVDHAFFCSKICGAKCCKVYDFEGQEICQCPKVTEENKCAIYRERFTEGQPFAFSQIKKHRGSLVVVKVECGRIEEIIKSGRLHSSITHCCYKDPELLEGRMIRNWMRDKARAGEFDAIPEQYREKLRKQFAKKKEELSVSAHLVDKFAKSMSGLTLKEEQEAE